MGAKRLLSRPGGLPGGIHRAPGDKSISHRALLLSARAGDETEIRGFLDGSDCRATANALRALGVDVRSSVAGNIHVRRYSAFVSPSNHLDLGNSGTGLRLLTGMLAGLDIEATLTGDTSLRSRPMKRIADPLQKMGAIIEMHEGRAPLSVKGSTQLRGIEYVMPIASAQVKSAILLAGLSASHRVVVHEPAPSRDHTERMLCAFGASVERRGQSVYLEAGVTLRSPGGIDVPGDLSSAAFLLSAAAMRPGASVTVRDVGVNPTRTGFLNLLARMGAKVSLDNLREWTGEPVADLTVEGAPLRGIGIDADDVALAIDEIPVLLAVAAVAEGETVVHGAGELRVKESDRLAAMSQGLGELGITNELRADGIRVIGGKPRGGVIESWGDHRIAMTFAVLGQVASGPVEVLECDNVDTSFPAFAERMQAAGLDIRVEVA